MKYFVWDNDKNELLKKERNISFEHVVCAIDDGSLIAMIEHPNKQHYAHQKIFIIRIHDYIYLVPFVEDEEHIVLKTIIPSRKATKRYLKEKHHD